VGNAVKFTDAGHVRITAAAVATGGVEIVVRDTGVGIAADALPHIFAAFHQAPGGPTRRHGGSGLGLAIAARLADQMAGSIDVRSEPNIGTTFRLRLPEAPSAAAAAREPAVAAPDDPA
jgi:signal transduction histidine kinase